MITGDFDRRVVKIDGKVLSPLKSQEIWNHSPDGFCWGYSGSGSTQLALAFLLEFTDDEQFAKTNYQQFKFDVVAALPQADFELDEKVVKEWIESHS